MEVDSSLQQKGRNRGKLYRLSSESTWEDQGTGIVSIVRQADHRRLVFKEETTGNILHDRKVWDSDTYQLQGEGDKQTIIIWEDPELQQDLALSFQGLRDIAEIWNTLRQEPRLLPLPTLDTLPELARALLYVHPSKRELIAAECILDVFVDGIVSAFRQAEDLRDTEILSLCFRIIRGVFLLSNQKLTERYLQPDVYLDVLGMLEYDEGLPMDRRIPHRQVHSLRVRFKQAVNFEDPKVLDQIHLSYRLQYVKDRALPRLMDDVTVSQMTQMVQAYRSSVLDHVQKNNQLLRDLLSQIQRGDVQSLFFLQDMCRLARQIPPSQRQALVDKLTGFGLLALMAPFLRQSGLKPAQEFEREARPRHVAVECLLLTAQGDAALFRRRLAGLPEIGRELIGALVFAMHSELDQGVQSQAAELLQLALDTAGTETSVLEQCLSFFYAEGALGELLTSLCVDGGRSMSVAACFTGQMTCDLLAFAVEKHGPRARGFIARDEVGGLLVEMLASRQRFLQAAVVRLMRVLVQDGSEVYAQFLIRHELLASALLIFQECHRPPAFGGGLFASAMLRLMGLIHTANATLLIDHLCRRHPGILQEFVPRFKVCSNILLRHELNLQSFASSSQSPEREQEAASLEVPDKLCESDGHVRTDPYSSSAGSSDNDDGDCPPECQRTSVEGEIGASDAARNQPADAVADGYVHLARDQDEDEADVSNEPMDTEIVEDGARGSKISDISLSISLEGSSHHPLECESEKSDDTDPSDSMDVDEDAEIPDGVTDPYGAPVDQ